MLVHRDALHAVGVARERAAVAQPAVVRPVPQLHGGVRTTCNHQLAMHRHGAHHARVTVRAAAVRLRHAEAALLPARAPAL